MLRRISWSSLAAGFVAMLAVSSAIQGVFFVFLGSFMLMLGASPFRLWEQYASSPIGFVCGSVAAIAGYFALGYVIAWRARANILLNITTYFVLELLFFLLASGLHVPGFRYIEITFGEIVVFALSLAAGYFASLGVYRVRDHS